MTQALFTSFAIVAQIMLVAYFLDRLWRPVAADKYGWIVYGMGVPALFLAVLFIADGDERRWWLGPLLFAVWALYGATLDVFAKIQWRDPIRWPYFGPFVALYSAAQVMLWIPLWFVSPWVWGVYSVLFGISTGLNIRGHFAQH
jgi:hypothetical protein